MNHELKIKLCGMRDGDNILAASQLPIDMMGFICWEGSSRNVTSRPSFLPQCQRVGVFVNPTLRHIVDCVRMLDLNRIQLHGSETQAFCRQVGMVTGLPITKAISVSSPQDIERYHEYIYEPSVDLFLFDTKCQSVGGSGKIFDWNMLYSYQGSKPFLLAGGIAPGTEQSIISFRHQQFAGIDLNSCFETSPAVKDIPLLSQFITNIQHK